jgi:hypothetical protein
MGLAYIADPPAFSGRVMACPPTSTRREYVRVVDYRSGRMTLIPKPADVERLFGRTVHLTRDRERGLSLQIDRGLSR